VVQIVKAECASSRSDHERQLLESLALAKDVLALANERLNRKFAISDELSNYAYAQALRGQSYFRSCLLLAQNGDVAPMGALLRCLIEQYFVAVVIANDPSSLATLRRAHQFQRRRALNNAKNWPDESPSDATSDIEIDKRVALLDSPTDTAIKTWATLGKNEQLYETTYCFLGKYVHASLKSCDEHLLVSDGLVVGFSRLVGDGMLPCFVVTACQAMLLLLEVLNDASTEFRDDLARLSGECRRIWDALPIDAK
jgi:Family of unknown function (DUF5677)